MPLKLRPPRPGKTPYYTIRGTHLGIYIEESAGTSRRDLADKLRRRKEADIEAGRVAAPGELMFPEAAINYMEAGGERQFLAPLIRHFDGMPVKSIDQPMIDRAAAAIYPNATAATRNRQVYTPVSAVLKRAGIERKIKRPIGWRGRKLTHWLTPAQAVQVFAVTRKLKAPSRTKRTFRALLITLCYTGMRLGDALGLDCGAVDLTAQTALLPVTKNGRPRLVYLPRIVVQALRGLPDGLVRSGRVFFFHDGGRLRDFFDETMKLAGIELPRRVAFHVFCHTWGTWMRQHGGLDTYDLLKTDRWSDPDSADRYAHVVVNDIAKRADLLPVPRARRRA